MHLLVRYKKILFHNTRKSINLKIQKKKNQPTKLKQVVAPLKILVKQTEKKVWELIKESVPLDKIIWRCMYF